ncbi:MAG: hypothetical protein JOZ27_08915 [Caulobacteraceae bacterium]|nr:hypothetical protein [Caulobacteraceae bacterium]
MNGSPGRSIFVVGRTGGPSMNRIAYVTTVLLAFGLLGYLFAGGSF